MATWYADGSVSGPAIELNSPEEAIPGLTRDVYRLVTAGTVNANAFSRLQYDCPGANFRRSVDAVARLRFTASDINRAVNAGRVVSACMFVIDDAAYPAGYIPSPREIRSGSYESGTGWGGSVSRYRADEYLYGTGSAEVNTEFNIRGFKPAPNRRYWIAVMPTENTVGAPADNNNDIPVGSTNTVGRAISIWGNRTPLAPTITSPGPDNAFQAGQTFNLTYVSNDPDAILGQGTGSMSSDQSGVQVQYAPKPTVLVPSPTWIDLPIATRTGTLAAGAGWYLDRSRYNAPIDENNSGAAYLYFLRTMPVRCGSNVLAPGAGVLPSGDWQIRVRTFDYGHPFPRWFQPLATAVATGEFAPSNFPATNTSPWSTPVKVSVAAQVPPALAISPTNNTALVETQPVTLLWRYRNTYLPPFAQARREVQIRKAGDANWTLVTDTYSSDTSYTLSATPADPRGALVEYLPDGGFESGSFGNWTTADGTQTNLSVGTGSTGAGTTHGGTKALLITGTGRVIPSITVTLQSQHTVFSVSGWSSLGSQTASHSFIYQWIKSDGDPVSAAVFLPRPAGGGFIQVGAQNLQRPPLAASLTFGIVPTLSGANSAGDRYDDFSIVGTTPGSSPFVVQATTQYEWRVRTTDSSGAISNYSPVARFYAVPAPASGSVRPVPSASIDAATLGCGTHRAFVYRRGGLTRIGELTQISSLDWGRLRDDISDAKIVISGWGIDCGNLLARLQTWAYEIVIFRDNGYGPERVWEGPITLLTYERDTVTIQAKDVMAYAYRRIVKQTINDSKTGRTVTQRAANILQNVFAPDDPNILSYLQQISDASDANQYRNLPAFSRTAYEEIDDMAANAGLDYCTVGRSIMLWGTKHRIGTLPEFRDQDLGAAPIVSEYGMQAANFYSVGDGSGNHGDANRLDVSGNDSIYGLVEMLSSSWASDSPEDAGTYTQEGLATVIKSFEGYAERSIADRYPPPVVVRVPDNTTLSPGAVVSIQNLVPGVVIPLRSNSTLRAVAANQKLDSIKVTETSGTETITVVMSPFSREDIDTAGGEA